MSQVKFLVHSLYLSNKTDSQSEGKGTGEGKGVLCEASEGILTVCVGAWLHFFWCVFCQNTKLSFFFFFSVDCLLFHSACPLPQWCHCVLNACFDTGLGLPCGCGGIERPFSCPKNERREDRHTNCWSDWARITVTIVLNSIHYYLSPPPPFSYSTVDTILGYH